MTKDEITAVTLLLLYTWSGLCMCDWYSKNQGKCSRCFALESAQQRLPLIHEAFSNTIEKMEQAK
jgi:hypothetical protein